MSTTRTVPGGHKLSPPCLEPGEQLSVLVAVGRTPALMRCLVCPTPRRRTRFGMGGGYPGASSGFGGGFPVNGEGFYEYAPGFSYDTSTRASSVAGVAWNNMQAAEEVSRGLYRAGLRPAHKASCALTHTLMPCVAGSC